MCLDCDMEADEHSEVRSNGYSDGFKDAIADVLKILKANNLPAYYERTILQDIAEIKEYVTWPS